MPPTSRRQKSTEALIDLHRRQAQLEAGRYLVKAAIEILDEASALVDDVEPGHPQVEKINGMIESLHRVQDSI